MRSSSWRLAAAQQVIGQLDRSPGLSPPAKLSTVTYVILEAVRRARRLAAASAGVYQEASA